MMKMRLASPAKLVDINRIPGLDTLERVNGHLRVGALVRHADIVRVGPAPSGPSRRPRRGSRIRSSATSAPCAGRSRTAIPRATGTRCCSPPAPTSSHAGRRASGRSRSPSSSSTSSRTALADDEMVTEVRIPGAGRPRRRFVPEARAQGRRLRHGRGRRAPRARRTTAPIAKAGLALTAVVPVNTKVAAAEAMLVGQQPSDELFAAAGEVAAQASEPRDDVRGSAEWKRNVVRVLHPPGAGGREPSKPPARQ